MNYVLENYALLVPLAPLLAALATARLGRSVSDLSYKTASWALFAGLALSISVLVQLIADSTPIRLVLFDSPWHFLPEVALSVDRLAAVMMVLISGIGTLLYRYSTRYLQQDEAQPRYHTLLALSVSALLFMVSSSDLVTLFICWQLLTWFLSLLTHNYGHEPTANSAFRIFITLRIGDVAFLAGIALAYRLYGSLQFAEMFPAAATDSTVFDLGLVSLRGSTAVLLLVFLGAMCKSAQFPLHLWLPDSLFAPTPVSGLLHAGLINGGGFLLNRLAPLYSSSSPTLHLVFVVGLITTVYGTAMMLAQNNIKKTLAYSTIGQMGFMIMECGVGAYSMAVFHLAAHGLFKATLFLNCGDVIRQARIKPALPPQPGAGGGPKASGWIMGFVTSLALPLVILVVVHEMLGIHVQESQGLQIFLFFAWVTASHAMLTLFRIKKTGAMAQGTLLVAITVIATAYLYFAEVFTHFLYDDPEVVQGFFDAAALPQGVFYGIAGVTLLLMGAAWVISYRQRHGAGSRPLELRSGLYLLVMNGFYVDGIGMRLHGALKRWVSALDRSGVKGTAVVAAAALGLAATSTTQPLSLSGGVPLLLAAGLALPLFPLHGVYVSVVTRVPGAGGVLAAVLLPLVGVRILGSALPEVPAALLPAIQVLALGGALFGSLKALVQTRTQGVLAYGGLAAYSTAWWHITSAGSMSASAVLFVASVAFALGGLLLAWGYVRERYGDLAIQQLGGLFRGMPALAVFMMLLVMAAVGLPPFGLFFGYLGMLTATPEAVSISSSVVFFAWFASSWYLFRLMQRLLFGPARADLSYQDLSSGEATALVAVVGALVLFSAVPQGWADSLVAQMTRALGGAQ
jgi:NADH-quinone oxidoreductase subunit L